MSAAATSRPSPAPFPPQAVAELPGNPTDCWIRGALIRGHGVASGRNPSSPYPAGTISLQRPLFAQLGLDLSGCFAGTLNLSLAPLELRTERPDHCFEHLHWSDLHPPETFRFWQVQVRLAAISTTKATPPVAGWIYQPDPATKVRHEQPATVVEVLAPPLGALPLGTLVELGVDPARVSAIDGVRLRARLLEFFKFRVLAAQEAFFSDWREPGGGLDAARLRHWLEGAWPEALALPDQQLLATCAQAWQLYGP